MELQFRGGAAAKELPFNILRYAKDSDELLAEFVDLYYLDREFTVAGFTILRPADDVLKGLIAEMKKVDSEPPDPKFITQQEKGLRFILKGAITPGILHASHFYVSMAQRAYVIYAFDNTIYIRESLTSDPNEQKKGVQADLIVVAQNGSSIYRLKGELPKGVAPLKVPSPRTPVSSPVVQKRKRKLMFGGAINYLPCEVTGGALVRGSRYKIMEDIKNGSQELSIPAKGADWAEFFIESFCVFVFEAGCPPDVCPNAAKEAVLSLLTGNPEFDALIVLEPLVESPLRPEASADNRTFNYLVPDEAINKWIEWWTTNPKVAMQMTVNFHGKLKEMMNEKGATKEFVALRAKWLEHMRGDIAKTGESEKAKSTFINNTIIEMRAVYEKMGSSNVFTYEGESAKVLPSEAYGYLKDRFGKELASYLQWKDLLFLYCVAFEGSADLYDTLSMMLSGFDFKKDIEGAIVGSGVDVGMLTLDQAISGGFLAYFRASLDSLDYIGLTRIGGRLFSGAGFSHIDTAYREFNRFAKRKRKKGKGASIDELLAATSPVSGGSLPVDSPSLSIDSPVAGDLSVVIEMDAKRKRKAKKKKKHYTAEYMEAAKRKRKKLKKRIKELKKKRGETLDEEANAKRKRKRRKLKKKLKRKKLRRQIGKLSKAANLGLDEEANAARKRKRKALKKKLKKKRLKKKIRKLKKKAEGESAEAKQTRKTRRKKAKRKLKKMRRKKRAALLAVGDTTAVEAMDAKRRRKKAKRKVKKKSRRKQKRLALRAAGKVEQADAKKQKRRSKKKAKRKRKYAALAAAGRHDEVAARRKKRKSKKKTKRKTRYAALRAAGQHEEVAARKKKRKMKKKAKRKKMRADLRAAGQHEEAAARKKKRKMKKKAKRKKKYEALAAAGRHEELAARKAKRKQKKKAKKQRKKAGAVTGEEMDAKRRKKKKGALPDEMDAKKKRKKRLDELLS